MEYNKPSLSFDAQADLLIQRGLVVDKSLLVTRLKSVNYYRLSGYLYPYRILPGDAFRPGTKFDLVWRHYTFDRRLRVLLMDAVERIEVSVRTLLIHHLAQQTGPFGYTNPSSLPKLLPDQYAKLMERIAADTRESREVFVEHFFSKYGDRHEHLPLWMAAEIMSFGRVLTMYRGVSPSIKRAIARHYMIPDEVLTSWLVSLNAIRNVCAHHGRLWNRELGYKTKLPFANKNPEWHHPVTIRNNRVFVILTIARYLLKTIAPQSGWKDRLYGLLDAYPEISRQSMGFPDNWKECPIWQ